MTWDFSTVETTIRTAFPAVPAAQLCIIHREHFIYNKAFGFLDPDTCLQKTDENTRFDLASVTKLFTTTAFMTLVEEAITTLDQPVHLVLPEFSGLRPVAPYEAPLNEGEFINISDGFDGKVDAGQVTFRHLLTHTSGLPAWRPFYLLANSVVVRWSVLTSYFSYPTSRRVIYSDLGLILVGMALETLTGKRLDAAIHERVLFPLGLTHTGYIPTEGPLPLDEQANLAPTEICRWRKRRLIGEVDDENCGRLGGISGHAGLFSTARDLAAFGLTFLREHPLLSPQTVTEMTHLQTGSLAENPRGIGFDLWKDDPESFTYPFNKTSYGHTGFTGTSLWIDPERQLVVALLTNEVYHGRNNRTIASVRKSVHKAIIDVIDGDGTR